jgi:hypothetical protein
LHWEFIKRLGKDIKIIAEEKIPNIYNSYFRDVLIYEGNSTYFDMVIALVQVIPAERKEDRRF